MADVTLEIGYGRKIVSQDFDGPADYDAGVGFVVRLSAINRILKVLHVSNDAGYKVEPADCTIVNNALTIIVRYYEYSSGADGPAIEIAGHTDLQHVTFQVCVIGI